MAGIMGIGLQALSAAQVNLLTTQHNIANANTAGFHRQQAVQSSNLPIGTGVGFIGTGSHVDTVRRMYNQYLNDQVQNSASQTKFYDTYYSQIRQIDNLLADPSTGLSPAIQDFFSYVNAVANDPASLPARQAMVSGGESLVSRFKSLFTRFDEIRNGVDTQLTALVTDINSYSAQIASLNQRIIDAESTIQKPANDLRDQRDQAIANLNELIKVTVLKQDNGAFNVFIGNGQTLVVGTNASNLAARDNPSDPEQKIISYVAGSGFVDLQSSTLENGGSLGALLNFRRTILDESQNALGRIALGLARTFNNQHQLGQDLNGTLGSNFFTISSTSPRVYSDSGNTGTGAITTSLGNVGALNTSNYAIEFDGTNYTLTDLKTNTATTGLTVAALTTALANVGVTFSISGSPAAGDKWQLLPTRFGANDISVAIRDPNLIAAAAPIRSSATTTNTGSASISAPSVNSSNQPPLNANLQATVTLTFTGTGTFDVNGTGTGNPSGVAYTSGGAITYNGWTVNITGTPQAGDVFTISTNTGSVGDNRNALALAGLQNANLLANNAAGSPTSTYQGAYTQIVSSVGTKTREVKINGEAFTKQFELARESRESFSGVNLDEEAANLLRFQQSYQAAAKMIQVGSTLFETILNIR